MADDTADQVTTAPRLARRLVTRLARPLDVDGIGDDQQPPASIEPVEQAVEAAAANVIDEPTYLVSMYSSWSPTTSQKSARSRDHCDSRRRTAPCTTRCIARSTSSS